jgi:uncharacterized glyoxalase superfamily protein PhnB
MNSKISNITKLTPVRIVDRIEPCLAFWCDQLGYGRRSEVPHPDDGSLGFVLLESGASELMLQTRKSLAADIAATATLDPHTVLFVEVRSLSEARAATRGSRVLVEERTTFYGMRESVVVDPAGTVVVFAEKA